MTPVKGDLWVMLPNSVLAVAAMSFSSVSVIGNALRGEEMKVKVCRPRQKAL